MNRKFRIKENLRVGLWSLLANYKNTLDKHDELTQITRTNHIFRLVNRLYYDKIVIKHDWDYM